MSKAALITGSAKRIGREMALMLAAQGYDIALNYHKSQHEAQNLADEIVAKYKVECTIFQADLSNLDETENLAKQAIKKFPYLNLLINNASVFHTSKFLEATKSQLDDNLNIHFLAPLFLAQNFAKNVIANNLKSAQIINMVDKNIVRFDTNYFHYLLSKKILAELTKMLSLELAPHIRVNGIAPGFILQNVNETEPSEYTKKIPQKIPLQTKGDVKNILQTVQFLLENDFVTGQIIFVDGGASLNHAG